MTPEDRPATRFDERDLLAEPRFIRGHRLGPLFLDLWRDCDGTAETLYVNVGLAFGYRSVSIGFGVAW